MACAPYGAEPSVRLYKINATSRRAVHRVIFSARFHAQVKIKTRGMTKTEN